ncbi:pilus assembly protein TadG-related protein [Jiella avicenniae]|uniref:Pilus assembly protein TadG-related protein n=1 Tax=Jiella avicenniae TaxID=2907202 RepID=A0A9X1P5E1_9HYPH|nr:pilus assembly protein TadG-related protein [Jiella avicenniae]MCE7029556.1 pilus assembly protein TadG-related protein [Jiella avicenniae]
MPLIRWGAAKGRFCIRPVFDRFFAGQRGNFGIITGLAALPLIVCMGGAVDYSNALREKSMVQSAADAAVLAAAKYTGDDETERKRRADMLFNANVKDDIDVTSRDLSHQDRQFVYTAKLTYPTAFLGLMHLDELNMVVTSVSQYSDIPLDIALVLDTTGSMGDSNKMVELKKSVNLFLDQFKDMDEVQVGMVPFNNQVKLANVDMTMVATAVDCSYVPSADRSYCGPSTAGFVPGTQGVFKLGYSNSARSYVAYVYRAWSGWGDQITVQRDTNYCSDWTYKWCTKTTSTIYNRSSGNTKVSGVWSGCVIDRAQPYDTLPDAQNPSNIDTLYPRDASCTSNDLQPVQPLTSDLDRIRTAVSNMQPIGGTNVTIGVQWGMEVLTATAPMTGANADENAHKIMIVLTDGTNTINRWNGNGHDESPEVNARTKLACASAKAMKNTDATALELYTIRLIDGNETLLSECATDGAHYYSVNSASQLQAVFADIAERVKRIRIVS